jgi:hypothetical protein
VEECEWCSIGCLRRMDSSLRWRSVQNEGFSAGMG